MALSSVTQHAMPPEFGRKWGGECLNTRFPLPTEESEAEKKLRIYYFAFLRGIKEKRDDACPDRYT